MSWKVAAVACLLFVASTARAHRIDEYLQATTIALQHDRATISMRLIPGVRIAPSVIANIDTNHDGAFSESEMHAYGDRLLTDLSVMVDGQAAKAHLDAWNFPQPSQLREGLGEILIQYHLDLPSTGSSNRSLMLANHHLSASSVYLVNAEVPQDYDLRIVRQKRNEQQSVYELEYQQIDGRSSPSGTWHGLGPWPTSLQYSSLFCLGMSHIREGTDHLLFLLVLLLPAPLLAVGARWSRVASVRQSLSHLVGIVTAFTLGHSLTLTLAAMNFVHVPVRPVEVLIAVSILVSALHALTPIFPGREAWIAAFFGLIHGLAFATTLERLGLSRWDRVAGILAFNLGIETMQLVVVAFILPSLLLMSRTRAYPLLRICGAALALIASVAWIGERLWRIQTPVDAVINALARKGMWAAASIFAVSFICWLYTGRQWTVLEKN